MFAFHLQTPQPEEMAGIVLHASSMAFPALSNHSYSATGENVVLLHFMGGKKTQDSLSTVEVKQKTLTRFGVKIRENYCNFFFTLSKKGMLLDKPPFINFCSLLPLVHNVQFFYSLRNIKITCKYWVSNLSKIFYIFF